MQLETEISTSLPKKHFNHDNALLFQAHSDKERHANAKNALLLTLLLLLLRITILRNIMLSNAHLFKLLQIRLRHIASQMVLCRFTSKLVPLMQFLP